MIAMAHIHFQFRIAEFGMRNWAILIASIWIVANALFVIGWCAFQSLIRSIRPHDEDFSDAGEVSKTIRGSSTAEGDVRSIEPAPVERRAA